MDGLDVIEANEAWRRDLRQHGIAFVQADDLAKEFRSQLKPVSQTIKETRENVIELLTSRGIPKCEIGELGASLKVIRRPAKKAPTRAAVRDRCKTFFDAYRVEPDDDPETSGDKLFAHLFEPTVTEAVFLRRGKMKSPGGSAHEPGDEGEGEGDGDGDMEDVMD